MPGRELFESFRWNAPTLGWIPITVRVKVWLDNGAVLLRNYLGIITTELSQARTLHHCQLSALVWAHVIILVRLASLRRSTHMHRHPKGAAILAEKRLVGIRRKVAATDMKGAPNA